MGNSPYFGQSSEDAKQDLASFHRDEDADLLRLFIAIALPDSSVRSLETVQDRLRQVDSERAMNWVGSEGFHVTLKFLGETSETRLTAIDAGLIESVKAIKPFRLKAVGVGCFPKPSAPQTVWCGIQGDLAVLDSLQRAVELHIAPLGFPTEKRAFMPHLTFGRVRSSASQIKAEILGRKLSALEIGDITSWPVNAIHLIRSDLRPSGAVYTTLATYPFSSLPDQK